MKHILMKKLAAVALVMSLTAGAAVAQSSAEFFNGKTINYIVATDPGGGYDTNGRLVAEFMQKHLPGSTIVVRNMPGAGQLIGTNFVFGSTPDGLTIGTFNTGLIYSQLIGDPGVRFDLAEMGWIGKVAADPRVILVSEESGIKTFDDLKNLAAPVKFATCGVGCASMLESTMLIKSIGLPIELVSGYNGNDDQLALRRGEVAGIIGSRSSFEQFVAEGHGRFIAQIGGSQTDVPQLSSMVDSEVGLRAVALVESQGNISRLTAAPPGLDADKLAALRDAYAAATADPEFLTKAEALGLPIDPLVGQAVGDAVAQALNQTPEMVDFLKQNMQSSN